MSAQDSMNPATADFYNEQGEEGMAAAFFGFEGGRYWTVLIAEKRWKTPKGMNRSKRVTRTLYGQSPDELAAEMLTAGWEPPPNLKELCEAPPTYAKSRRARLPESGQP